jgi:GT2 family glycosyltransferase
MQDAAIVILNYNGGEMLRKFLPSVCQLSIFQVVVVDNGSTDHSVEVLQTEFPQVRTILLDSNFGFTGGYNRALAILRGSFDYYILLNSDVQVEQEWDLKLIQFLKENSAIAAVQPKILSYKNEGYFDYAGAGGGFLDRLGYPYCRGRIFNTIEKDIHQYEDTIEVDWTSGACMAIRSTIFHTVEGFDESFFAHMEEIDLCWRVKKMGFPLYYLGASKVWHVGGGTLDRSNPWKTFLNFRNNLLMLYKNVSPNRFVWIYLARLVLDLLASVTFLVRGSFRDGLAVFEAHIEFHKMKPKLVKTFQHKQKHDSEIRNFRKSILWDYYIRGKKTLKEL